MVGHTMVYIICGVFLPEVVKACRGELGAIVVSVMICIVQCLSFAVFPLPFCSIWMVLMMPIACQIIENSPFAWLEKQDGFEDHQRGGLTGWLNSATSASKLFTSFVVGPVIAASGGHVFAALVFIAICQGVGLLSLGFAQGQSPRPTESSGDDEADDLKPA